jgi:hypothetical protein
MAQRTVKESFRWRRPCDSFTVPHGTDTEHGGCTPVVPGYLVADQRVWQARHTLLLLLLCLLALQHLSSVRGAAAEWHCVAGCCSLALLKPVTPASLAGHLVG